MIFHQVFGTNLVSASSGCCVGLITACEHGDSHVFAGARGQRDHAADHLVGMTRINAQVQRDFDGFVELGGRQFLDRSAIASSTP